MASNRKKQDEKHLKILRNLVSLPGNKQCFDCSQRGPTYVNTTIGSFVCTSCSGLLRGLTPPHRVKSISMATFTPEEIESIKSRGNEYCKKVWLGHYDSNHIQDTKDEQHVKDFMIAKYERKRYYLEPSAALRNGSSHSPVPAASSSGRDHFKIQRSVVPTSSLSSSPSAPVSLNVHSQPQVNHFSSSASGFGLPDPFGVISSPLTKKQQQQQQQTHQPPPPQPQPSFANFDNNPVFNSSPVPAPSMTTSASFPAAIKPPAEDKYAALKDLDCLMKMQQETQSQQGNNGWTSNGMERSTSLNPFQVETSTVNNVHNPFRSGLVHQVENSSTSNVNNSSSSPWAGNPWSSNVNLPISHSMPFPNTNWNGNGNLTVSPGNSSNPFL